MWAHLGANGGGRNNREQRISLGANADLPNRGELGHQFPLVHGRRAHRVHVELDTQGGARCACLRAFEWDEQAPVDIFTSNKVHSTSFAPLVSIATNPPYTLPIVETSH